MQNQLVFQPAFKCFKIPSAKSNLVMEIYWAVRKKSPKPPTTDT